MFRLAGLLLSSAFATNYNIKFCVHYDMSLDDVDAGDYWTNNSVDRKARGIRLRVQRTAQSVVIFDGYTNSNGCKILTLDDSSDYRIWNYSEAETNGVLSIVYDDDVTPQLHQWVQFLSFSPGTSSGVEHWVLPYSSKTAKLAVAGFMLHRNNMGLGAGDDIVFYDTDSQRFDPDIPGLFTGNDSTGNGSHRPIISHEVGHMIGYRRDEEVDPEPDYEAPEDDCDGSDAEWYVSAALTKEWQGAAALEGLANLMSAWAWNNSSELDCENDIPTAADFDLDLVKDNIGPPAGVYDCEGIPLVGLESYVTSRDWLEDLVNASDPAGCNGSLQSRGTAFDWQRYGWDMLTDGGLTIDEYVDIFDDANSHSWDKDDNAVGSHGSILQDDDVIVRWAAAADLHGFLAEHNAQKDNGQDH